MNTLITARNLWHNPRSAYSPRVFTYSGRPLFEHRSVRVFKNPAGSWDYIFADFAITQRAGFDKAKARAVIDEILDGTGLVADAVANELRKHGFTPKGYADADGEGHAA
jgi:hypothetical protein